MYGLGGGGVGDHIFEKIGRNHQKFRSGGQYEQTWQVDGGGSFMRNTNRPTCPTNRMLGKHIRSLGMDWMAFRELYKSPTAQKLGHFCMHPNLPRHTCCKSRATGDA